MKGDVTLRHETNAQMAPFPEALAALVDALEYKPGFDVSLRTLDRGQGSVGLTLCVLLTCADSYHPDQRRAVMHYFPVPPAAYDERTWRRWLLDRLLDVDVHEACEWFRVDGVRPFAPNHGPGRDPYTVFEYATDEDRRTSFRGEVKP